MTSQRHLSLKLSVNGKYFFSVLHICLLSVQMNNLNTFSASKQKGKDVHSEYSNMKERDFQQRKNRQHKIMKQDRH